MRNIACQFRLSFWSQSRPNKLGPLFSTINKGNFKVWSSWHTLTNKLPLTGSGSPEYVSSFTILGCICLSGHNSLQVSFDTKDTEAPVSISIVSCCQEGGGVGLQTGAWGYIKQFFILLSILYNNCVLRIFCIAYILYIWWTQVDHLYLEVSQLFLTGILG